DRQRMIGFWGLSIGPMPHRLIVNRQSLYAWCAWDTLFLPELLGVTAEIESRCPTTGRPITLTVDGTHVTSQDPPIPFSASCTENSRSTPTRSGPSATTSTSSPTPTQPPNGPHTARVRSRSRSPTEARSPGSATEHGSQRSSPTDRRMRGSHLAVHTGRGPLG